MNDNASLSPSPEPVNAASVNGGERTFSNIPPHIAQTMSDSARIHFEAHEDELIMRQKRVADWAKENEQAFATGKISEEEYKKQQKIFSDYSRETAERKELLMREEKDYADMVQRTNDIADRNGLPRQQIEWDSNYPNATAMNSAREPHIKYGWAMVQELSTGQRDFIAAHELWHRMPENQGITDPKRKEMQADEFAARQPGINRDEVRKWVLSTGSGGNDHPDAEERLRNIERVWKEMDEKAAQKTVAAAPMPTGLESKPDLSEMLQAITAKLESHRQQATAIESTPTVAMASPATAQPINKSAVIT